MSIKSCDPNKLGSPCYSGTRDPAKFQGGNPKGPLDVYIGPELLKPKRSFLLAQAAVAKPWDPLDEERFLQISRPDQIPPPDTLGIKFKSSEEIQKFLAESTLKIDVRFTVGKGAAKSLDQLFFETHTLTQDQAVVLTKFLANNLKYPVIPNPGKNPQQVLGSVQKLVEQMTKAHQEINWIKRLMNLDQTPVGDSQITIDQKALDILFNHKETIQKSLYQSYKNVVPAMIDLDISGENIDETILGTRLVFITGEKDLDMAKKKFVDSPLGKGIRFVAPSEKGSATENAKRIAIEAAGELKRKWLKPPPPEARSVIVPPALVPPVAVKAEVPALPEKLVPPAVPDLPELAVPAAPAAKASPPAVVPAAPAAPVAAAVPPAVPLQEVQKSPEKLVKAPEEPQVYILIPQKQNKEVAVRSCGPDTTTIVKMPENKKVTYICKVDRSKNAVKVPFEANFDKASNAWSWNYTINGGQTEKGKYRSGNDIGIILYPDGASWKGDPIEGKDDTEMSINIESKVVELLAPSKPAPRTTTLSILKRDNLLRITKHTCEDTGITAQSAEDKGQFYVCQKGESESAHSKLTALLEVVATSDADDAHKYRLADWVWRIPNDSLASFVANPWIDIPAENNSHVAFFKTSGKTVIFKDNNDLMEKLLGDSDLFGFAPNVAWFRTAADHREFSPQISQKSKIERNGNKQSFEVEGPQANGKNQKIRLERSASIIQQNESDVIFEVTPWKSSLTTDEGDDVTKSNMMVIEGPEGLSAIVFGAEDERDKKLQVAYDKIAEGIYRPRVSALAVGIGRANVDKYSLTPPVLNMNGVPAEDIPFHQASARSVPGTVNATNGFGYFVVGGADWHPGAPWGKPFGGAFLTGNFVVGGGERVFETRLHVGLGVSLREITGWSLPGDFSIHSYLLEGGYNSFVGLSAKVGFPVGACVTYQNWKVCYDHNSATEWTRDTPTGPRTARLESSSLVTFSYDFGDDMRPHDRITVK